jgi:hypothetical protein
MHNYARSIHDMQLSSGHSTARSLLFLSRIVEAFRKETAYFPDRCKSLRKLP